MVDAPDFSVPCRHWVSSLLSVLLVHFPVTGTGWPSGMNCPAQIEPPPLTRTYRPVIGLSHVTVAGAPLLYIMVPTPVQESEVEVRALPTFATATASPAHCMVDAQGHNNGYGYGDEALRLV